MDKPIIFFDLETTGTNVVTDRIVEIAMIKLMPTGERISKRTLVNPIIAIPKAASDVHGITFEMVKDAPLFKNLAKAVHEFVSGCDLAGFNSDRFDIPLLIEEFGRCGLEFPEKGTKTIDVLKLERVVTSHTLGKTYERYFGEVLEGAHSALTDVTATIRILEAQIDKLGIAEADVDEIVKLYSDTEIFDYAGNFYVKEGKAYWNMGKHKDKPLDCDLSYCSWFLDNSFPIDSKRKLKEYLKTRKV